MVDLLDVNDHARALYCPLGLYRKAADRDRQIVDALKNLRWFTHVIISVLSWQDMPDAFRHDLVIEAIANCRRRGLKVIWCRWLWPAWLEPDDAEHNTNAHLWIEDYAKAILTVKREAGILNADGTGLDGEPYGKSPVKFLKDVSLSAQTQASMTAAILAAVAVHGRVDLIMPTSSTDPGRFVWPMTYLADNLADAKSYYIKDGATEIKVNAPIGITHKVGLWGSNVTTQEVEGERRLSVRELKALDFQDIKRNYQECQGQWVYVDQNELVPVMQALSV